MEIATVFATLNRRADAHADVDAVADGYYGRCEIVGSIANYKYQRQIAMVIVRILWPRSVRHPAIPLESIERTTENADGRNVGCICIDESAGVNMDTCATWYIPCVYIQL